MKHPSLEPSEHPNKPNILHQISVDESIDLQLSGTTEQRSKEEQAVNVAWALLDEPDLSVSLPPPSTHP